MHFVQSIHFLERVWQIVGEMYVFSVQIDLLNCLKLKWENAYRYVSSVVCRDKYIDYSLSLVGKWLSL